MPYETTVDDAERTILVRGYGRGTTEDTLRLIAEMREPFAGLDDYAFIYDSTALSIESSPADMIRVANALFGDVGAKFSCFAIVVPAARVPLARIFAALAHPFGVTANVFGDVESARDWLAEKRR